MEGGRCGEMTYLQPEGIEAPLDCKLFKSVANLA